MERMPSTISATTEAKYTSARSKPHRLSMAPPMPSTKS
jgi:hypothetical protein